MSEERKPARAYWRHIVGWPLLVLGIAGLALPFLQGILFIVVALTQLAPEVPLFRRAIEKLKTRFPAVFEKAAKMQESLRKRIDQP